MIDIMKNGIFRILTRIHRRRPLVLLLTVAVSLVLVMGNTYSWFTDADKVDNILKTPDFLFDFEVEEEFTPPGSVAPGQNVQKIVNVENMGDQPGFVRVLVLVELFSENGEVLPALSGTTFTLEGLNVTDYTPGNPNMWADGGDGYYYYLGKLAPGKSTVQPLFSSVSLPAGLGAEYTNAYMIIDVKVEASSTYRSEYRDGWWKNGDNPPATSALISIDDVLKELAKTD